MKIALFTTDISAFRLVEKPDIVVVPENRSITEKVNIVINHCIDNEILWCWQGIFQGKYDFALSWLYSQIIPKKILDCLKFGGINFHGDTGQPIDAPYRQRTLRAACERGDKSIRLMWHKLVEKVDTGEVFIERTIPITSYEDTRQRMIDEGISMFKEIEDRLFYILNFFAE